MTLVSMDGRGDSLRQASRFRVVREWPNNAMQRTRDKIGRCGSRKVASR
jgi:hypothetical protein